MKSIALQSVPELGGRTSVLNGQKRDHVELNGLLDRLQAAPPASPFRTPSRRRRSCGP
jgi:hypothetical protein